MILNYVVDYVWTIVMSRAEYCSILGLNNSCVEKFAVYSKESFYLSVQRTFWGKEAFLNSNGEHYVTKRQPFLRIFIQIELLSIWNNVSAINSCIQTLFTNSALWAPTFVLFMVLHWLMLFHRTNNLLLPKTNPGFCKYIFS